MFLRAALFTFTGAVSFRFRLIHYDRFSEVIGLIIIGETVACTLRVIFCGDFKVPKKPEKKVRLVHFWEARRRQGWPRFWALFWTLFWDFLKKSAFTIPSQNGPFLPDLVILPGRPTLRCAPPALQVLSSRISSTKNPPLVSDSPSTRGGFF